MTPAEVPETAAAEEHPALPYRGPGLAGQGGPVRRRRGRRGSEPGAAARADVGVAVAASAVLLLATGAGFLIPWPRRPAWLPVLVPVAYTGSVLALILAAGVSSGVGIVILIPLVWTALFGTRLQSGCVVLAIVAVEVVISLTPTVAPAAVIARRMLLWATLGALVSLAAHGLRDRIRKTAEEREALEGQLRELSVLADRDRIAADLRDGAIQRVFAAGGGCGGTGSGRPAEHGRAGRRAG